MVACLLMGTMLAASPAQAAPSAAEVLQNCAAAMDKVESLAFEGQLTMGLNTDQEGGKTILPLGEYGSFSGAFFRDPLKARLTASAIGRSVEAYAAQEGSELCAYMSMDGAPWTKHTTGMLANVMGGMANVADVSALTAQMEKAAGLRVEDEPRAVGDRQAYCVSATVDVSAYVDEKTIQEALKLIMGSGALPEELALPIQVSVFVDVETAALLRIELDISAAATTLFTAASPNQPGIQAQTYEAQCSMTIDFQNANAAPDFEIPTLSTLG